MDPAQQSHERNKGYTKEDFGMQEVALATTEFGFVLHFPARRARRYSGDPDARSGAVLAGGFVLRIHIKADNRSILDTRLIFKEPRDAAHPRKEIVGTEG